jgi:transcriptional regulator with XRE-family HTH domain
MLIDPVELARTRALIESGAARRIRVGAKLSLREVADAVGATPATVYRWERRGMVPRGDRAIRYGRLLRALVGASE